jgi:hypothetical protein
MQLICRRPSSSLSLLFQAIAIIACQYYSTLLVSAQEAAVGNPCLICPGGNIQGDDYAPYASAGDPITCKELIDDAKLFETGSLRCAEYEFAVTGFCCNTPIQSHIFAPCVPMVSLFLMIMNLSMMDQQQHPLARTKDSLLLTIMIHTIMETRVRIG